MGILSWIAVGLVAGILAKLIMPGKDPGGLIITILLGIAGAIIGGYVGAALGLGSVSGFNFMTILLAVVGALILLVLYRALKKKKA